jgi:hypothetical protein
MVEEGSRGEGRGRRRGRREEWEREKLHMELFILVSYTAIERRE